MGGARPPSHRASSYPSLHQTVDGVRHQKPMPQQGWLRQGFFGVFVSFPAAKLGSSFTVDGRCQWQMLPPF
ncbi:hypothetical protein E2562_015972 [Oryza meyeriana var. granulata]|uniref:Uncharacterized protein n=1 Tax=Oryza meyeriana var. granulata TaxID=110450 RepID=A0A6G1EKJ0_9ORYZ|nr:hypothetical protein E2562_015972 [Oryza meyeriana var. granulata]